MAKFFNYSKEFADRLANHCYYDFDSVDECTECHRCDKCWAEVKELLKEENNEQ